MRYFYLGLVVMLASIGSVFAQSDEVSTHRIEPQWSILVGNRSGVSYEHPIGKHFSMYYSTGLLVDHRFQPYAASDNHKFTIASEYRGIMPYLSVGSRWYPSIRANNSGFYLGLGVEYIHHKWKFAIKESQDVYKLEQEFLVIPSVGYTYNLAPRFNVNVALAPTFGAGFAAKGQTVYGVIDLRWNLGVSYSF